MKDFELSEEAVRALTAYAESWDADGMASAVSAFAEKVAPLIDGAIREMGRKWEQFAASIRLVDWGPDVAGLGEIVSVRTLDPCEPPSRMTDE